MTHCISKKKKTNIQPRRAGIIILKKFSEEYKVLCLRVYGSFDFPKGGVEPFENIFAAAIRETEEESGIDEMDFKWGLETTQAKNVTLFIAETTQEPIILPNPETGEYEHHEACWKTLDQASECLHPYLRPCVDWVRETIGMPYV